MSVVAVKKYKDKIVIGADSFIGFSYDTQLKDKEAKLFKHNGMVVGVVGYASDLTLFSSFTKSRKPKEATTDGIIDLIVEYNEWAKKKVSDYKNKSWFIIVFSKKAFFISEDFYVLEIKKYRAMGAGQDMAQTALFLGQDVKKAIAVACELSIYCEKPINIIEIKNE